MRSHQAPPKITAASPLNVSGLYWPPCRMERSTVVSNREAGLADSAPSSGRPCAPRRNVPYHAYMRPVPCGTATIASLRTYELLKQGFCGIDADVPGTLHRTLAVGFGPRPLASPFRPLSRTPCDSTQTANGAAPPRGQAAHRRVRQGIAIVGNCRRRTDNRAFERGRNCRGPSACCRATRWYRSGSPYR